MLKQLQRELKEQQEEMAALKEQEQRSSWKKILDSLTQRSHHPRRRPREARTSTDILGSCCLWSHSLLVD